MPVEDNAEMERTKPAGRSGRRFPPIHPLLLAAFPVLALVAHNLGAVPIREMWRPLALAVGGVVAIWLIALAVLRHARRAAVAASAVGVAFFSYGHALNLMPAGARWIVLPAFLLLLAAVLVMLFRSRAELADVSVALNLAALVLVAPSVWSIVTFSLAWRGVVKANPAISQPAHSENVRARIPVPPDAPDVYYIILDAYGRADSLRTFYNFDNTPFVRALEQRGFYVPPLSRSNYDQTPLCLSSALNMTYLDGVALEKGYGPNVETTRSMIAQNAVAGFLRDRGYHFVEVWAGTDESRVETADLRLDLDSHVNDFEGELLGLTALDATDKGHEGPYDEHRAAIRTAFKNLGVVAKLPYHKFVFAHILAPHPPFVFGPNGEDEQPEEAFHGDDGSWLLRRLTRTQYIRGYTQQLQFVNSRTLAAVDRILAKSKRRPIIIIQGDHGSRMNLDWESLDNTDVREPFSILNAYLVPPKTRRELYDTISPVNSFRVVFDTAFGAKMPLLPDRSFYSTAHRPFDFQEVTRMLPKGPIQPNQAGRSKAYDPSHPATNLSAP